MRWRRTDKDRGVGSDAKGETTTKIHDDETQVKGTAVFDDG